MSFSFVHIISILFPRLNVCSEAMKSAGRRCQQNEVIQYNFKFLWDVVAFQTRLLITKALQTHRFT
jgi:hypothetical protein